MKIDNSKNLPRGFVADQLFIFTFEENENIEKSIDKFIQDIRKSFDKEEKQDK